MTNKGAIALAESLHDNNTLESLLIGANFIEEQGVFAIANALVTNTSLRTLNIRSNKLTGNILPELTAFIKKNEGLNRVYVDRFSREDQQVLDELEEYLKKNDERQTLALLAKIFASFDVPVELHSIIESWM